MKNPGINFFLHRCCANGKGNNETRLFFAIDVSVDMKRAYMRPKKKALLSFQLKFWPTLALAEIKSKPDIETDGITKFAEKVSRENSREMLKNYILENCTLISHLRKHVLNNLSKSFTQSPENAFVVNKMQTKRHYNR